MTMPMSEQVDKNKKEFALRKWNELVRGPLTFADYLS